MRDDDRGDTGAVPARMLSCVSKGKLAALSKNAEFRCTMKKSRMKATGRRLAVRNGTGLRCDDAR